MANERFRSVWDAIERDPVKAAALEASANAMIAIKHAITSAGLEDEAAATYIGSTVEQVRAIRAGHIDLFTPAMLAGFVAHAGLHVETPVTEAA
jgi:predicted XRE-type DNA-binding protein